MMHQHRRARLVPQFPGEAVISRVVGAFAHKENLVPTSYHHDEPVWYISQEEKSGPSTTIRMVQLAAFYGDLDLPGAEYYALWAIPFAQEIDEGTMMGWTLDQVPDPPEPIPGNKIDEHSVHALLSKAWDIAKSIKRGDIRKSPGTPLPSKPVGWPPG
jgi:hypothetical protein